MEFFLTTLWTYYLMAFIFTRLHTTEDFLGCVAGSSIPTLNAPLC